MPYYRTTKKKRPKPLWLNKEAAIAIKNKEKSYQMWKRNRHYSYTRYCAIRNECTRKVKSAKTSFEAKLATECKTKPKAFWKYVQSKRKVKEGGSQLRKGNGLLAKNELEKVEELNRFFSCVFVEENVVPEDLPLPELANVRHPMGPLMIIESEVESKLNKLKDCKSAGPDNLKPCFLRNLSAQFSRGGSKGGRGPPFLGPSLDIYMSQPESKFNQTPQTPASLPVQMAIQIARTCYRVAVPVVCPTLSTIEH